LYQELAPMLGALCKSFTYRRDVALQFSSLNNLSRLVQCHYPNLSYACLSSCDKRIVSVPNLLNDGSYYRLTFSQVESVSIDEAVYGRDILVYENKTVRSDILSAELYYNNDLVVFLPKNGIYTYRSVGSQSTTLDEVRPNGEIVPIKKDMLPEGVI
nr:hypothetical protein [Bacilli bacterium]